MHAIFAIIVVINGLVAGTCSFHVSDVLSKLHKCDCERREEYCYIKAIESFRPFLKDGIPQWDMLKYEPYEPGRNYRLLLKDHLNTLMLTNISMSGLTRFDVINIRVHGKLPEVTFEAHFPGVHLLAVGYRNLSNLRSTITGEGHEINHEFNNFRVTFYVRGYTTDCATGKGETECFYLSNIRLNWYIQDEESHMKYFNLSQHTSAQSNNIPYEPGVFELKERQSIQTTVLHDISEDLCNSLVIMLLKLPIKMLCGH